MQLENQTKFAHLNSKKQEICVRTENAIQELKLIDNAFAAWIKRFEQTHVDSVINLEVAFN